MIDSLSVALRGVQLTKSKHNWSVRREGVSLGQDGVDYWALVATVTGNG